MNTGTTCSIQRISRLRIAFDWGHVAPLGTISLLTHETSLSAEHKAALQRAVIAYAEELIKVQEQDGYRVLIDEDYPWGSNGLILNNMLLLGMAHKLSGEARYLDSVRLSMDYILGRNALNKSFVAGYGTYPMLHPHHRFWANDPARGFPPPLLARFRRTELQPKRSTLRRG